MLKRKDRIFKVLNRKTKTWDETPFENLKAGDHFIIEQDEESFIGSGGYGVWEVLDAPYKTKEGYDAVDVLGVSPGFVEDQIYFDI